MDLLKVFRVLVSTLLFFYACAYAGNDIHDKAAKTTYIVRLKDDISGRDAVEILRKYGFEVHNGWKQIRAFVISHVEEDRIQSFQEEFKEQIVYFEEDHPVQMIRVPDDTRLHEQTGLGRMGILRAWDRTIGSYDVVIAVSDTGINPTHQDLINQLWTNFAEVADNGIDDDGNGYIDDIRGWNFIYNEPGTDDDNGHGSHVAGIIGAQGANGFGTVGVNWHVSLMPLKFLDSRGRGRVSGGVSTILYAADNGAHILNASWGSAFPSRALDQAIDYAYAKGMIVVAAAGNNAANSDLEPLYPAASRRPGVVSVASSARNGELSSFSNFGAISVDLGAPGSNILSTYLGLGHTRLSGTSMAAPMASGVAGLILSVEPKLSGLGLKNALLNATVKHDSYRGLLLTEGDLNAEKAVTQLDKQFKIMPENVSIKAGESFQFYAYMPRGSVSWKIVEGEKLAEIDASGRLLIKGADDGVVKLMATDEQGNEAYTQMINVEGTGDDDGDDSGGGCTKAAYAGTSGSSKGSGPMSIMGYVIFFFAVLIYRRKNILNI